MMTTEQGIRFGIQNMVDEAGIHEAAKAMHSLFKTLRDTNKGNQRHHTSRNAAAQLIRQYRAAWDSIFS